MKYLSASGLWEENIKNDYSTILAQGDDYLKHVLSLDWSEQRKYLEETIGVYFHVDSIICSARKGIVSINYDKWDRNAIRERAKQCIENGEKYTHRWEKGYDNSIEFSVMAVENVVGTPQNIGVVVMDIIILLLMKNVLFFCETD